MEACFATTSAVYPRDKSTSTSQGFEDAGVCTGTQPAVDPNTSLPELPTELWVRVFSFLDCQYENQQYSIAKDTLSDPLTWEPWLTHRLVNRRFKAIIESLYASRYLRGSAVVVDVGGNGVVGGSMGKSMSMTTFEFSGFGGGADLEGKGDRFAMFRRKVEGEDGGHLSQLPRFPSQHNYHPSILVQIGTGATDLLPSDLQFIPSNDTLLFDWRTYFCMLLTEAKLAAAFRNNCWQRKIQHDLFLERLEEDSGHTPHNLVQLATSLYREGQDKGDRPVPVPPFVSTPPVGVLSIADVHSELESPPATDSPPTSRDPWDVFSSSDLIEEDDHGLLSSHAITTLILAAGTYDIGADGRYREVRRQRRRRIWERVRRQGHNMVNRASEGENDEQRMQRMAFEKLHEGRVAKRLLMLQVEMERKGC